MKFTARERTLLYALLIIIILAAFALSLQYFSDRTAERETELTSLQNESARVKNACDSVAEIRKTLPQLKAQTKELQSLFTVYAGNPYIDDKITQTASAAGLTPYVLTLEDPVNTSVPFFGGDPATQATGGMFYVGSASFTAYGRESALLAFLDAAQADASLHVRSFSYTGARTGSLQILFVIDVYMYSPQVQADE